MEKYSEELKRIIVKYWGSIEAYEKDLADRIAWEEWTKEAEVNK